MANEQRLIDANDLMEELSTLSMVITGLRAGKGVVKALLTEFRESVLRIVDEQPTVDAVPVRCEKCQFSTENPCNGTLKCTSQKGLHRSVEPYEFCSWGENTGG